MKLGSDSLFIGVETHRGLLTMPGEAVQLFTLHNGKDCSYHRGHEEHEERLGETKW